MASSFRSILEGLANSGQGVELQKKIREFIRSGAIDRQQADNLFSELVPIATQNETFEPLSPQELADLRESFANLDGSGGPDVITRALKNNQITKEESNAFFKGLAEKREREGRGPVRDTSNFNKDRTSSPPKPFTPSSRSGSSTSASQPKSSAPSSSGSNLNREGFTKLIEGLQKSKAEIGSRLGGTNTPAPRVTATAPSPAAEPAPRVTGPAFKAVNTPVSNPDAPTNNVTKPTGAAAGPAPKNKRDARVNSEFAAIDNLDLTDEQKSDLKFNKAQEAFGPSFNKGDFSFLLNKLEGSKIRQNRDAQSQERKNIYSRGLSSMFANF